MAENADEPNWVRERHNRTSALISLLVSAAACPRPVSRALSATAGQSGTVALTFDDGPHPVHTEQVLDVLRAHGVRATFFLVGQRIDARPELVRRTVREGHVMGNHTWSHPTREKGADMDALPLEERARQMGRMTDLLYEATRMIPCFFRSPQGAPRSAETQGLTHERGMTVTHWGPSGGDAFQAAYADLAEVQAIVERSTIPRRERPIVLLHDGGPDAGYRGNTVAALPEIIRCYEHHGYTFTDPAGRMLPRMSPRIHVSTGTGTGAEAGRDVEVRGKSWALRVVTEVHLQVHRSGGWRTVASSGVDATNAFRVTLPSPDPGVLPLRVVVGSVTSNSLEVEVPYHRGYNRQRLTASRLRARKLRRRIPASSTAPVPSTPPRSTAWSGGGWRRVRARRPTRRAPRSPAHRWRRSSPAM